MHITNLGGYALLILLATLAPSPIPIPLDGIIIGLIAAGLNPLLVIAVAAVGDIIGTLLIYMIGTKGGKLLAEYHKKRKRNEYAAAEKLFQTFGYYALLLSGVPFLGDALIFVAGLFRLTFQRFFVWFILGKILWYTLFLLSVVLARKAHTHFPTRF